MKQVRHNTAKLRANLALIVGSAMLLGLVIANVLAFTTGKADEWEELRYEPPHIALFRQLLWSSPAKESAVSLSMGLGIGDSAKPTAPRVFKEVPPPIAQPGHAYHYAPQSEGHLSDFTLQGQPAGLSIDPTTGVISGTPTTAIGEYKVRMEAQNGPSDRVQLEFPVYVDDRFLPLGSDAHGRNVLAQLLLTMKYTLLPGAVAVLISMIPGLILGAYGGFSSGSARLVIDAFASVMQGIPSLLLVFLAAVASQYNIMVVMMVVGLVLLPETAQGVMERVRSFRDRDFIEAARELGLTDRTILWNEIIWHNARSFLVTRITQGFIFALLVEITLSYLRLTDANAARLGTMLLEGRIQWFNGTSRTLGVVTLTTMMAMIATFSLVERGLLQRWVRK